MNLQLAWTFILSAMLDARPNHKMPRVSCPRIDQSRCSSTACAGVTCQEKPSGWIVTLLLATVLVACHRPDLRMVSADQTRLVIVSGSPFDPIPAPTVQYGFVIDNFDYGGNLFMRPAPAVGPVSVVAQLSSDGVLRDGMQVGSVLVIPMGSSLLVGQSMPGFFGSAFGFDEGHPFVVMTVVSSQTEKTLANNSRSRLLGHASPSNLSQWLREHPGVKRNLRWEMPGGTVLDYNHWDATLKQTLQDRIDEILSGSPPAIADPPPLAITPSGTQPSETRFTESTAKSIFLVNAARSIVSDGELPWKVGELNDAELTELFDSRWLFNWNASKSAYLVVWSVHGRDTPGDPNAIHAFLKTNNLIGESRVETVQRLLDWSRGLVHYLGDDTAANYINQWQYAGYPPVSRILSGTVRTDDPFAFLNHYTAGCWGTSGFFSLMLRTVNIPANLATAGSHAMPRFIHEQLYLSHGDDPYALRNSPWIPIAEVPISATQFNTWFGPGTSFDTQNHNISRRVGELTVQYLTDYTVRTHCQDVAAGLPHASSLVYASLSRWYTVADLEAVNLWGRLDAKAVELGYCTP
jgi:hypothetical protein